MFVPEWDGQVCSLGYDVIDWIEAYCCHGPGDVQGTPVTLDDEMAAFVVGAYELHPRTGRRKIERAVLSRPKGRAKSEVAGMLATAEAFGPVRFDGWDAAGQPSGKPVTSPLIKCLATEETQAGNTFENAAYIVCEWGRDTHPAVYGGASGVRQYQSATAIYLPNGGEMRATTSGAASKDGGKETFVVPDETHLYVRPELRSMYATVARNCGKRKEAEPWMLQTTTAYEEGQDSVAEKVLTAWKAGRLPNAAHWLVDHREAIGDVDLTNRLHTLNQLRYVYGAAARWMDLDRIYRTMIDPTECETPEVAARYFLNLPCPAMTLDGWRVVSRERWGVIGDPPDDDPAPGTLGLSMPPDRSFAVVGAACDRPDGKVQVLVADERPGAEWVVPRLAGLRRPVVIDTRDAAASLIAELEAAGVRVLTTSAQDFARACGNFYDDAMPEKDRLRHCAQTSLDESVKTLRKRALGGAFAWERTPSGAETAAIAVTLAHHGHAAERPSVYEERGMTIL